MTEEQAREKLAKLLEITKNRGATKGEQDNATRIIGAILKEHPNLRDMITGAKASESQPSSAADENGAMQQEETRSFWKGVLIGAGVSAVALVLWGITHSSSQESHETD